MRLAVNFSDCAAALVHCGAVQIDSFKVPESLEAAESAQRILPAYCHFSYQASSGDAFDERKLALTKKLLAGGTTAFVNSHLTFATDIYPAASSDEMIGSACYDLRKLAREFPEHGIALENTFMSEGYSHKQAWPAVIRAVVEGADTSFILDTAHATIAAAQLNMNPREYIELLPMERLVEIHFGGVRLDNGSFEHSHQCELSADDWGLIAWCFRQLELGRFVEPEVIALEYGGFGKGYYEEMSEEHLRESLLRLHRLMSPFRGEERALVSA